MTAELASPPGLPMTADEFLVWSAERADGRYELDGGRVVAMAAERVEHAEAKGATFLALSLAIRRAGLDCQAFTDGMAVRVDDATVYEPDASVRCGDRLPRGTVEFSDSVVVVEIVSPSSKSIDSSAKLRGYFRLPSLRHYVIVDTANRVVIHHAREGEVIAVRILHDGAVRLDPPGLSVAVTDMLPPPEAEGGDAGQGAGP